jgi:phosphatidylglycerophosphate synthase
MPRFILKYVKHPSSLIAIASIVFLFVGQISDYLDGIVARKFALTAYGHFVDSGADRIFAIGILWCICMILSRSKHWITFVLCSLLEIIDICLLKFSIIPIQYHDFFGFSVHFTKFTFGLCQACMFIRFILLMFASKYDKSSLFALQVSYALKMTSLLYYLVRLYYFV